MHTALLVFQAAAAGARIIGADLVGRGADGRFLDGALVAAGGAGLLGHLFPFDFLVGAHLNQEQPANGLLSDGLNHCLEHLVAFLFIGHHRVMLAVSPQADALLQIVHGIDVVHPVFVYHPQHDDPLQLPHQRLAVHGFLLGIDLFSKFLHQTGGFLGVLTQQLILAGFQHASGPVHAIELSKEHGQTLLGYRAAGLGQDGGDGAADDTLDHRTDGVLQVIAVEHLLALGIDDLTLDIHHVVIFQNVLSGLEIAAFHGLLGIFHCAGENLGIDGGILVQTQGVHHAHDTARGKQTHQVVLHTQVEAALAGVTLTAGTTAQLVIDTAGLVALGADDEQAAGLAHLDSLIGNLLLEVLQQLLIALTGFQNLLVVGVGVGVSLGNQLVHHALLAQLALCQEVGVAAQQNVGTTTGHVGGDGDGTQLTGLCHNLGFQLVILGVQHIVGDALPLEVLAEDFTFFNGNGAHQHGLPLGVAFLHLLGDGTELACLGFVHHVGVVNADDGAVGGNLHHVQLINGLKFLLLGQGSAGHAGELVVQAEEILEGDGCQGLALSGNGHAFLGLDGLVQTLVIPAAIHETASKLVYDDNFAVLHHIVDVPLHETPRLHGLVDVVGQGGVFGICQVFHAEEPLGLGNAVAGQTNGAGLFVHIVVAAEGVVVFLVLGFGKDLLVEGSNELVGHFIELGGILALAGDNQRGTGFINEDGVHLVHNGEIVAALHQLLLVNCHVVTQVIEAQFVVGAVGNIGIIGHTALGGGHAGNHQADGQTHVAEHLAHPLTLVFCQIVVDGDNVDTAAGEGVEVGGQNGNQGFAFAGLHFSDTTLVQNDAAHQLHREGAHSQHPVGSLPDGSKCLGEQTIQGFTLVQAVFQLLGFGFQCFLGKRLICFFHAQNFIYHGLNFLNFPLRAGAEYFCNQTHFSLLLRWYLFAGIHI